MIGEIVEHPQYGRGQIVALFRNGAEWMVRFESGLRFRRPRHEFNGQQTASQPVMLQSRLSSLPASTPFPAMAPMPRAQFEARQLVEALRVGIAPAQHIRELTIGLAAERADLAAALNCAHQAGGAVRAVVGDYGYGKTHLVELAAQEALQRGFLAATVSLDLTELPPHRSMDVYGGLMAQIRYPGRDERGLALLLEMANQHPHALQQVRELAPVRDDPLAVALYAYANTPSSRQRKGWTQWLMGGRRDKAMNKSAPRGVKFPSIYRQGANARQLAYLLGGVSVLARLVGYSGLCLLIDEAECYSLLRPLQRARADQFFQAVIYGALRDGQSRIHPDQLPQHHRRDYPPAYGERQSLFFLFTVTRSDNRMPLEQWLDAAQVIELDPHHTAQEIGHFLQQITAYHGQAYGYEPGDRQGQIRRGAAEHLALGMRNNRLSIRGVVRLAVELFDLLYLHPDYPAAALLDELRELTR